MQKSCQEDINYEENFIFLYYNKIKKMIEKNIKKNLAKNDFLARFLGCLQDFF